MSDDLPAFWNRIDQLYFIIEGYKKHRNPARWAYCCHTFERNHHVGALGHPEDQTTDIKDFLFRENIQSSQDFRRFMLKTLPKNQDNHILLPQVNMRHSNVKLEEAEQPEAPPTSTVCKKEEAGLSEDRIKTEEGQNEQLIKEFEAAKVELAALKVSSYHVGREQCCSRVHQASRATHR